MFSSHNRFFGSSLNLFDNVIKCLPSKWSILFCFFSKKCLVSLPVKIMKMIHVKNEIIKFENIWLTIFFYIHVFCSFLFYEIIYS